MGSSNEVQQLGPAIAVSKQPILVHSKKVDHSFYNSRDVLVKIFLGRIPYYNDCIRSMLASSMQSKYKYYIISFYISYIHHMHSMHMHMHALDVRY